MPAAEGLNPLCDIQHDLVGIGEEHVHLWEMVAAGLCCAKTTLELLGSTEQTKCLLRLALNFQSRNLKYKDKVRSNRGRF